MTSIDDFNALITRANELNTQQSKLTIDQVLRPTQIELEALWTSNGYSLPIPVGTEIFWVTDGTFRQLLTVLPKSGYSPSHINYTCSYAIPSKITPSKFLALFDNMADVSGTTWPVSQDYAANFMNPKIDLSGNILATIKHPYRRKTILDVSWTTVGLYKSPIWGNDLETVIYYIGIVGGVAPVWPIFTQIYSINSDGTSNTLRYTTSLTSIDKIIRDGTTLYVFGQHASGEGRIEVVNSLTWTLSSTINLGFNTLINNTSSANPYYPYNLTQYTLVGTDIVFLDHVNGIVKKVPKAGGSITTVLDLNRLDWKLHRTGLGNYELVLGDNDNTSVYLYNYEIDTEGQSLDYGISGINYDPIRLMQLTISDKTYKFVNDRFMPRPFYIDEDLDFMLCNPNRLGVYPNKFNSKTTGLVQGIGHYVHNVPDFGMLYNTEIKDSKSSQFVGLDVDLSTNTYYKHSLWMFAGNVNLATPAQITTITNALSFVPGSSLGVSLLNGTATAGIIGGDVQLTGNSASTAKQGMVMALVPFHNLAVLIAGTKAGFGMAAAMGLWNATTGEIHSKILSDVSGVSVQVSSGDFLSKFSRLKIYGFAPASEYTAGDDYDE